MDEDEAPHERKPLSKTKSCNQKPGLDNFLTESGKSKSLNVNDAVKSLDLALCRLKKNKLVMKEGFESSSHPLRRDMASAIDMFIDSRNSNMIHSIENMSALSINFSHYELMRNVSCSDCHSDDGFFNNPSTNSSNPGDLTLKDERIEKYFRSIEKWNRKNGNNDDKVNGLKDHSNND